MPELPEVEVTRLSFGPRILGGCVTAVRLGKPLRWPLGCAGDSLLGQTVGEVTRRGKYLWLPLQRGGLLMHLGMSGSLRFSDGMAPPGRHDHFDLVTTQGILRLTDPRRFGAVVWSPAINAEPAAKLLSALGLEPFDPAFTGAFLHAGLRRGAGPSNSRSSRATSSSAQATSTPARPCSPLVSTRARAATRSAGRAASASPRRSVTP
jgi:formamidopyrimidine-DNA glycosylase